MANITLSNVGQIFPEGTSVNVRLAAQRAVVPGDAPSGASIASVTVTNGALAFTGLTADVPYVARGVVGGVNRYIPFRISAHVPARKWRERVFDRRVARGTTLPGFTGP